MKTTVEISDDLLRRAKRVASSERITLRSLIEEGLRAVLATRRRRERFTLRDVAVSGKGPQSGVNEGNWNEIRDLVYRGRGS